LQGTPEEREESFSWVKSLIEKHGGFKIAYQAARDHIDRAIEELRPIPDSRERAALMNIAHFVIERVH